MDNVSVVRFFILSGLNETNEYRVTLFTFTLLYYCMIFFINISIIMIIILDENLHEPMYILLCSFCMNGLYGTTGFYPKFLLDLFSSSHHVMTKRKVSLLICFSWFTPFALFSINILLTSRLKLCGVKIDRLFCVNWVIVQLACYKSDTFSKDITAYFTLIIYFSHGPFIIWSYMHLIRTCVKSKDDRVKFMQTCVPHLISLVMFIVVPLFDFVFMRFGSTDLPQSLQNFISIEFVLIPPVMNPLVYGFKLTKIQNRVLGFSFFAKKYGQ